MTELKPFIVLTTLLLALTTSCLQSTGYVISPRLPDSKDISNDEEWQELHIPFYGSVLDSNNIGVIIISRDGIAQQNKSAEVIQLSRFKLSKNYLTEDGGLTRKTVAENLLSIEALCHPYSSQILNDKFYIIAACDNATQLWSGTFEKEKTPLIVYNFIYPNIERSDEMLLAPTNLVHIDEKIVFPSIIKDKIALLTENRKTNKLEILWQKNQDDGGIVGLASLEKKMLMLLGSGKLMESLDKGKSWKYSSSIVNEKEFTLADFKFRNQTQGFAIGGEFLFSTVNEGRIWTSEVIESGQSFNKIVLDKKNIVVKGGNDTLFLKKASENKWTKIKRASNGVLNDLIIYDEKLYVLINGKLFVKALSQIY
jgi:hypothetical protein